MTRRGVRAVLAATGALLLACGLGLVGRQAYLFAKGRLAERLIDRAWEAGRRDGAEHRPWSWADITPVARLRIPRLGIDRPILSGASGSSLAFGLGHLDGTVAPGGRGLCAVAGHRDTFAAFLRDLRRDDDVTVVLRSGERRYRIASLEVADRSDPRILEDRGADRLVLITCYPFSALRRGPLRYVVTALPVGSTRPVAALVRPGIAEARVGDEALVGEAGEKREQIAPLSFVESEAGDERAP